MFYIHSSHNTFEVNYLNPWSSLYANIKCVHKGRTTFLQLSSIIVSIYTLHNVEMFALSSAKQICFN